MTSYRQYCPVAKTHEILGGRWTILIVRELLAGQDTFNAIARGLPGIPRSILSERLRYLERKGVVAREAVATRRQRYELTEAGRGLKPIVHAMGGWGARWLLEQPHEDELDPGLLLWRMQNRLNTAALPAGRVVIHFEFRIGPKGRFWFVVDDARGSVCLTDPGFDVDLFVTADLSAFYEVWLGRRSLRSAVDTGAIRIEGSPSLERSFGEWFLWSPMARFVRPQPE